jgi:hypothetical protein
MHNKRPLAKYGLRKFLTWPQSPKFQFIQLVSFSITFFKHVKTVKFDALNMQKINFGPPRILSCAPLVYIVAGVRPVIIHSKTCAAPYQRLYLEQWFPNFFTSLTIQEFCIRGPQNVFGSHYRRHLTNKMTHQTLF